MKNKKGFLILMVLILNFILYLSILSINLNQLQQRKNDNRIPHLSAVNPFNKVWERTWGGEDDEWIDDQEELMSERWR